LRADDLTGHGTLIAGAGDPTLLPALRAMVTVRVSQEQQ
jgi:hypothetical protein